jgi:type IV pilus assembly protein PilW
MKLLIQSHFRAARGSAATQRGVSLVELMISITVGLLIIVSLTAVLVSSSGSSRTNQRTSEVQSNGRFAAELLKHDLHEAGFKGFTAAADMNTPSTVLTPITGECLPAGASAGDFVKNIRQGVWGSNDANPFAASCIPAANYARGDVLVVRKLASARATTLAANTFYFRTSYAAGEVFRGAPNIACPAPQSGYVVPFKFIPCMVGTPNVDLQDFPIETYVYYISPYTTSATESPLVPALYRVALGAGVMTPELVASGIENMQIQYLRIPTDSASRYFDASGINGGSTDSGSTEWDDVHSVRIWLLARNSKTEPGYVNAQDYVMGDQTYTVNDGFRRQLFTSVIQLRNDSRVPAP